MLHKKVRAVFQNTPHNRCCCKRIAYARCVGVTFQTIISIANHQSNIPSQQLRLAQALVISHNSSPVLDGIMRHITIWAHSTLQVA